MTLNGQDYSRSSRRWRPHVHLPVLCRAGAQPPPAPHAGPALGGRRVSLWGGNFSSATTFGCRFGVWRVPATRVHAAEVRCAAPEAAYAGAADVLSLDFSEAWLMTRGAELRAPDHPLVPMPPFVVPQVYIPPEEKKLTALRITAEPAAHTRAGEPFAGALTAELLDQFGERFLTGDPNGNAHRVRLAMVRTHNATLPPAARLVAPCVVAAVPCAAPRALVALADGGIVSFGDLILNELGGGVRFELTLGDLAPVVTGFGLLGLARAGGEAAVHPNADEDNLQDVHFDSQPIVEVTDLGGNRRRGHARDLRRSRGGRRPSAWPAHAPLAPRRRQLRSPQDPPPRLRQGDQGDGGGRRRRVHPSSLA